MKGEWWFPLTVAPLFPNIGIRWVCPPCLRWWSSWQALYLRAWRAARTKGSRSSINLRYLSCPCWMLTSPYSWSFFCHWSRLSMFSTFIEHLLFFVGGFWSDVFYTRCHTYCSWETPDSRDLQFPQQALCSAVKDANPNKPKTVNSCSCPKKSRWWQMKWNKVCSFLFWTEKILRGYLENFSNRLKHFELIMKSKINEKRSFQWNV